MLHSWGYNQNKVKPDYSAYRHDDDRELLYNFLELFPTHHQEYQIRHEQILLALKINKVIREDSIALFEAGTGVGKSLAYLVPMALHIKKYKKKFVIATATTTLQQQLYEKDIPLVNTLCNTDLNACLFKGKSHYLCKKCASGDFSSETLDLFADLRPEHQQKFQKEIQAGTMQQRSGDDRHTRAKIANWVANTRTGDREELARMVAMKNFSQVWSKIHTQEYICGGKNCATRNYEGCFFRNAKMRARTSDIVVTNYSLLALHLKDSRYEEGFFDPDARIICDEAHRLSSMTASALSKTYSRGDFAKQIDMVFGKGRVLRFRRALDIPGTQYFEHAYEQVQGVLAHMTTCESMFFSRMGTMQNIQGIRTQEITKEISSVWNADIEETVRLICIDLENICSNLSECINRREVARVSDELLNITQHCLATVQGYKAFFSDMVLETDTNGLVYCNWVGSTSLGAIEWHRTAIDLSAFLSELLFDKERAVICTSASLLFRESSRFIEAQLGIGRLEYGQSQIMASFDYDSRVFFGVSKDMVDPTHPHYTKQVCEFTERCLRETQGSTLVLCTSYHMVARLTHYLRTHKEKDGHHNKTSLRILSQGEADTPQSLAYEFSRQERVVLIATSSFWEGFDSASKYLQLIIIPRIPFPYPDDIIYKKRCNLLEAQGLNSFEHLAIPTASLRLKQGFGRLMRRPEDYGSIIILDTRIMTKYYGATLLAHLPIASPVYESQDVLIKKMGIHMTTMSS